MIVRPILGMIILVTSLKTIRSHNAALLIIKFRNFKINLYVSFSFQNKYYKKFKVKEKFKKHQDEKRFEEKNKDSNNQSPALVEGKGSS